MGGSTGGTRPAAVRRAAPAAVPDGSAAGGSGRQRPAPQERGHGTGGAGTGGAGTGGAGTGGVSAAPELVTSAQNAYWTTGQVTKVTSGTADLNVDQNTTLPALGRVRRMLQRDGLGRPLGPQRRSGDERDEAPLRRAATAPTSSTDGCPMGASDYATSWYTLDDTAGDYTMAKLLHRPRPAKADPVHQGGAAGQARPPSVGEPVGRARLDDGQQLEHEERRADAAAPTRSTWPGSSRSTRKEGLKIEAIHPQNEPGYARVHWTQSLFIDFIKTYLGPTFAAAKPHRRDLVRDDVEGSGRHQHRQGGRDRCGGAAVRQGLRRAVEPASRRRDAGAEGPRHADGAPVRQLQLRDARTGTRAGTTRASRRTITSTARRAGSSSATGSSPA